MIDGIYIGLMSGTSIDSIDACAINIQNGNIDIIATDTIDWNEETKSILHSLCSPSDNEIEKLGLAKNAIAKHNAKLVNKILKENNIKRENVIAIGSHGQTIRHNPKNKFTIQLDNAPLLAALTDIDVVFDFRSADIAFDGEGAPLTPLFHSLIFKSDEEARYILNLGGISNITVLDKGGDIILGFDCGPANTLIDLVCRTILNVNYDEDAKFSKQGKIINSLLAKFMAHPYFKQNPPKSTGRETFNIDFIKDEILAVKRKALDINDLLRTLSELTVLCVMNDIKKIAHKHNLDKGSLILCGGGANNPLIFKKFKEHCEQLNLNIYKSNDFNVDTSYLESEAFAYYAYLCVNGITNDLHNITNSKNKCILGCISPATNGFYRKSHLK